MDAVLNTEGPTLVLAGAGTGKTKVLTTRISHILNSNLAFPSQILSVTFTNKAAKEMRDRISSMIGENAAGLWLGTFHSIAAKILRQNAHMVGLREDFTIIDTDDQLRIVKQMFKNHNMDEKQYPPKLFLHIINRLKDKAISYDRIPKSENVDFHGINISSLYREYQNYLQSLQVCDFGDLTLYNLKLFNQHSEVCERYQNKFRYLLVDEYQDTNIAQYLWLRILAQKEPHNICCVGDDDQSIYGWRGAEVANILRFDKDFPEAKIIRLELNYRSTPHILGTASAVIANNSTRHGKELWTDVSDGYKIQIGGFYDDKEEARFIAEEIEAICQLRKHKLSELAVLVRAGFQTRAIEESLNFFHIPYKIIGGLKFYERLEIKQVISYIRLITNQDDSLAFERIVNTPRRGIGNTALQYMHQISQESGCSLHKAAEIAIQDSIVKGKAKEALKLFLSEINIAKDEISSGISHWQVVEQILERSGYLEMWRSEDTNESKERLENIKELLRSLSDYENLQEFLEHVSLVTDADSIDNANQVNVMTMHASKGLEFETVFLPGWEDTVFPSNRSVQESGQKGLEEERRLAYVAITRAKERLFITFANRRRIYGGYQQSMPSQFIDELPAKHCEIINNYGYRSNRYS
jgi:DNA helicase-2/ATP-dependent DNA helicase PcrA